MNAMVEKSTRLERFTDCESLPARYREKVEEIWQGMMRQYLTFSSDNRYMQAEKSTHYIHLIQPELITGAVDRISREKEKGI